MSGPGPGPGPPSPPSPPSAPGLGAPTLNRNVPAIDQPQADVSSLRTVVVQLRQGMQSLGGQRGGPTDRAATLADLGTLGLTGAPARLTSLETRMTSLEARVTAIEQFIATLPPPP